MLLPLFHDLLLLLLLIMSLKHTANLRATEPPILVHSITEAQYIHSASNGFLDLQSEDIPRESHVSQATVLQLNVTGPKEACRL
jgi:hypothetical protein